MMFVCVHIFWSPLQQKWRNTWEQDGFQGNLCVIATSLYCQLFAKLSTNWPVHPPHLAYQLLESQIIIICDTMIVCVFLLHSKGNA